MASLGVEGATPAVTQLHATRAHPASCSRCHCMHTKKTHFVWPQAPHTATDTRNWICLHAPLPPQAVAAQQGSADTRCMSCPKCSCCSRGARAGFGSSGGGELLTSMSTGFFGMTALGTLRQAPPTPDPLGRCQTVCPMNYVPQ